MREIVINTSRFNDLDLNLLRRILSRWRTP